MSHNYTLDEDTYLTLLYDDGTEMDMFAFIHVADPTKVKVGEQERAEEEIRLLDSTVRHVVPLLSVALAHEESELEASVERLFDEGGSADQGDSAARGGHDVEIESATGVRIIAAENVTVKRPKRLRKKRQAVTDADEGPPTDSITELNLCTLGPTKRFVISSNSSHHSSTNAAEAGIDSFVRSVTPPLVMTEAVITTNVASIPSTSYLETGTKVVTSVHASMFHDYDSMGTMKPAPVGSSYVPGKELSIGSRDVNYETLHEVFVPQWNVSNDTLLDDHDVSREFIDHLAPPVLFAQIREMDYHHMFMEFNVGTARQACLNTEVGMRTEYCLSGRRSLESECEKQADLLKVKDAEVSAAEATEKMHAGEIDALKQKNVALENEKGSLDGKVVELQSSVSTKDLELKELNVVVSSLRSQKDGLVDQVHALEATCSGLHDQVSRYERLKEQIEEFQDAQMNVVNEKVAKLDTDLLEMACLLEEKFYPYILTTIFWRSRAIEQGMQSGLAADIDHGKEGRGLTDVAAYNPDAEADFNSA
ncbi:hypothetical protein Tco_0120850 [Tanacetum coccineum]